VIDNLVLDIMGSISSKNLEKFEDTMNVKEKGKILQKMERFINTLENELIQSVRLKDHHVEVYLQKGLPLKALTCPKAWKQLYAGFIQKWEQKGIVFTFRLGGNLLDEHRVPEPHPYDGRGYLLTWNYVEGQSLPKYEKPKVVHTKSFSDDEF